MPTQNIFDLVDTWASGGGPYTSIKMNATDNDVGSASLLMDLQVATASKFSVSKAGSATFGGSITATASGSYVNAAGLSLGTGGAGGIFVSGGNAFTVNSSGGFRWSSNANVNVDTNGDLILTRRAAANLRLGAADAASGVQAQTLSVQSITGTNASAAAYPFTITGSQGTGTGAGGSIIFQVAPAGGAGPAQNTLTTRLQIIAANAGIEVNNHVYSPSGAALYFASNGYVFGGQLMLNSASKKLQLPSDHMFSWSNDTTSFGTSDVILNRDAANILALRNSTAAQAFRVYNTYDGTNDERGFFRWASNVLQIGTDKIGTGTARALEFQTDGTTRLTIAANGAVTFASGITTSGTVNAVGSNVNCGSFAAFVITSRGSLSSSSTGVFLLQNAAANDFDRLQFGGTTSSFPALKRNATALETKLADDSAYAPHAMQYLDVTDGVTAPASATGRARIYVDTADGDLKVIFADGTVKTIVTDT